MRLTYSQPMPVQTQLDPVRFAAAQRELFASQNVRVGAGRVVHAVAWTPWLEEHELPMPACHTGWAGHGLGGDVRPTRDPVTCRRCLTLRSGDRSSTSSPLTLW